MRIRSQGRQVVVALAHVLLLSLAACAGPATTAAPRAEAQPARESPVQLAVQQLLVNQAAGRVRTVSGFGSVQAQIAVPLANGQVSLLPSTSELESALARVQRRWFAGHRQPLRFEAFEAAFSRLTAHRVAVSQAGGESLVRSTPTDDRGWFRFAQVPEGRWLLVADMSSSLSILLWTVPVQVGADDPAPIFLSDGNILLEALASDKPTPAP